LVSGQSAALTSSKSARLCFFSRVWVLGQAPARPQLQLRTVRVPEGPGQLLGRFRVGYILDCCTGKAASGQKRKRFSLYVVSDLSLL
jgi:hypothetical protein